MTVALTAVSRAVLSVEPSVASMAVEMDVSRVVLRVVGSVGHLVASTAGVMVVTKDDSLVD